MRPLTTLAVLLSTVFAGACVATIGPVLVENRSTVPMVIRATRSEGTVARTEMLSLPAQSKVLVGRDSSGKDEHLLAIDVLSEQCVLRTGFTIDTGREGGVIVVNENGHIDRVAEGTVAPSGDTGSPTTLCPSS